MRDSHRDNKGGFGGGRSFGGDRGGRDFGGSRGGFNKGGFGGGHDRGDREMHKTICAKCGNSCEVPFRPNGDKPVYCSDCFKGKDGETSSRRDEGRSFERSERPSFSARPEASNKEDFRTINEKLDRILKALSKETPAPTPAPKADKPEVKSMKVAAAVEAAIKPASVKKAKEVKEVAKPKKAEKKVVAKKKK